MITKEQIINILEEHTFKVHQHGDVVAKSDFDSIADCIVKNLNIPDVSQRSELLAFINWYDEKMYHNSDTKTAETVIDEYLKVNLIYKQ